MIEPTPEMVREIHSRIDFWNHGGEGIAEGLAVIFARIERGRVVVDPNDLRMVLAQRNLHAHRVPGRWDADGRSCDECAARDRLRAALGGTP